ncbi:hypothetical protein, partial [Muribaculum intestinale]|uniref:hypothetical protein n=3 Tax=Muribaculum intestinale TaxID=1796646 RepID=UPI0025A5A5CB
KDTTLFRSSPIRYRGWLYSSNDNRIGSVTVWVDKATDTAYLYAFYPAATGDQAKITCHKMVLGAPID